VERIALQAQSGNGFFGKLATKGHVVLLLIGAYP
jgi:hypothetical protein